MNCQRIETLLIAYLDGKARESERRDVELHLAACAACRTRAEEFRRLWSVLDEAPLHEPSPAFDARLRERIAAEPKPGWLAWLVPSPRWALAISLLVVLSVWISSLPPATPPAGQAALQSEEEFKMIKDLEVLEDYDVLANFEPLSELPVAQAKENREM